MFALSPDTPERLRSYFEGHQLPFPGVAAPAALLDALGQKWSLLGFGRQPALVGLGRDREVAYRHIGRRPQDLPDLSAALDAVTAPRPAAPPAK